MSGVKEMVSRTADFQKGRSLRSVLVAWKHGAIDAI